MRVGVLPASGFCHSVPCDPADDSGEDAPPTRQQKTGQKGGKKRAAGHPAAAHAQPSAGQQHPQLRRQQRRQKTKTLQAQPPHEQHAAAAEAAGFDYDAARSAAPGLDLRMSAGASPADPGMSCCDHTLVVSCAFLTTLQDEPRCGISALGMVTPDGKVQLKQSQAA